MSRPAVLALVLMLTPVAAGQGIITDRPDFTESTQVVRVHSLQGEAGITISGSSNKEAVEAPELLLRFGLSELLEARLEVPTYTDAGDGARGFGDAAAGVKLRLGPFAGWGLASIAMLSLPVGDSAHGSGRFVPSLTLTASRDLLRGIGLGAQAGLALADERVDLSATLVAGIDLSDQVGTFLELSATDVAHDAGLLLHHGYTLALGEALQLDLHAGAALAGDAPAWLVGAGVAARL